MVKKNKPAPVVMGARLMSFHFRPHHSTPGAMRVWRSDWFGDQFEIFGPGDFESFRVACKRLGIPLDEAPAD